MKEHAINSVGNFISGWYTEKVDSCDKLIQYFQESPNKVIGTTNFTVNKTIKDSTDCQLVGKDILNLYWDILEPCLSQYKKQYSYCDYYAQWGITDQVLIQYYSPNGGYYQWHTERTSNTLPVASRHLVFMTYLNDVNDSGETEWFYQKTKIKPVKGLTVIWPADWTFTHKGIPSPTEEKYIVTGWFNFIS